MFPSLFPMAQKWASHQHRAGMQPGSPSRPGSWFSTQEAAQTLHAWNSWVSVHALWVPVTLILGVYIHRDPDTWCEATSSNRDSDTWFLVCAHGVSDSWCVLGDFNFGHMATGTFFQHGTCSVPCHMPYNISLTYYKWWLLWLLYWGLLDFIT